MAKMKKFDVLEHTSEMKFRSYGKSLNVVFEKVVLAFSNLVMRVQKVKSIKSRKIKITGKDNESLLYDFIDELIYLFDAKCFIVSKAKVKVRKGVLEGALFGDSASNYSGLDHIKSATYAEMYVKKKNGNWEAQFVVDV